MLVQTKQSNHLDVVKTVLQEEANAIINFKENLTVDIEHIIEALLECSGRVIVTGVGKSGIIGRKIVATLASTGTPSLFLHPAEGLHGDLGMVTSSDIVLALSNSGESDEVLNIIPSIKRIGAKIIALVGNENSTLAEKSDYILCTGKVKEACPLGLAPTTSTTLTLALGDSIAIALLKARNFKPENFAVFHPGGSLGKKLLLTVNDLVESNRNNPITKEHTKVKDVIFNMTESGLGAISVVNDEEQLIGILTDGDIRRALSKGIDIFTQSVKELYNENPTTIYKTTLAAEALNIMETKKINVLPVIDEENLPIAMIHIHDLTRLGL
jgi:arabinose-5-phosphate isomerase